MTRTAQPLNISDLSDFARALHRQLPAPQPSHLSLLNMLARAAGFQNLQHLQAQTKPAAADPKRVEAALRYFDARGRLIKWPGKTNLQHLCLWALSAHLPQGLVNEREISALLDTWHLFGDAAILRRTLVELGLVSRSEDGAAYTRRTPTPPPEATALIAALAAR
jgi:hypothetical protein